MTSQDWKHSLDFSTRKVSLIFYLHMQLQICTYIFVFDPTKDDANFSILAFLVISTLYKEGGPVGMSDVTEYFKKVSAKGRNHITHPLHM